jgi:SAM-dependent methyltransferase
VEQALRERMAQLVAKHYQRERAQALFRERVEEGLRIWERAVCAETLALPSDVLDLGCGAGREALALAALGHRVTCLDTSPELIEIARELARERGADVRFECVPAGPPDLPEASFDAVLLWSQLLANVPGADARRALLAGCAQLLRPTGRLSLSVHDREATLGLAREQGVLVEELPAGLEPGDTLTLDSPGAETVCYWHYFTREELVGLLRDAGLEVLACERASALGDADRANLWIAICARRG